MPPKRSPVASASARSVSSSSAMDKRQGGGKSGGLVFSSAEGRLPSASATHSGLPSSPQNRMKRGAAKPTQKPPREGVESPLAGPGGSARSMDSDSMIAIPHEDQLMQAERLQAIADQLSQSLVILRTKLSLMEQRIARSNTTVMEAGRTAPATATATAVRATSPSAPTKNNGAVPLLPFQVRRAQEEKEQLAAEIAETSRTIRRLLIMTQQLEGFMRFKDAVFAETKDELETEIAALRAERADNLDVIRDGYIGRINLLHRYWPWRQLLDLGDTSVGGTFEEELKRGPRYRHVGVQNSIESDYVEAQLRWLEHFSAREEMFQTHLRRLDALVEDLHDINDLLESTLTCQVCNLLFDEPVIFWPCGHTFCKVCFESLTIAPSLFRCPICGSIGSEGYVHNLLIGESVAKWMFKDSGYGDLQGPLNSIRVHLSRFRKDRIESKRRDLQALLKKHRMTEKAKGTADTKSISVSYRAY